MCCGSFIFGLTSSFLLGNGVRKYIYLKNFTQDTATLTVQIAGCLCCFLPTSSGTGVFFVVMTGLGCYFCVLEGGSKLRAVDRK